MRLIGLLVLAAVLAIALWLIFIAPQRGAPIAPPGAAGSVSPSAAALAIQKAAAEDAARKADAAAKAKAAKAKAEALAAERAVEAAQADALEQNMTPAQNRLNEDYAAQVGDTRPAASDPGGDNKTAPD